MPYRNRNSLPGTVRDHLPPHAQDIYLAAFNSAWEQYRSSAARRGDRDREETAHAVAWAAVKKKYEKRGGGWRPKEGAG